MNTFDLQVHSTASDGAHPPRELAAMAHAASIRTIALTDHDTVSGLEEITAAGAEAGVEIIPGVELSVNEHGAHILGYGIDWRHPSLARLTRAMERARVVRAQKMTENLKGAGFVVEWEDVLREATGPVVGRPHIARAVLGRVENKEKLGGASTVHEFIATYLSDESPLYVPQDLVTVAEAIRVLHETGGVVVWSHPAIHFPPEHTGLEAFLTDLVGWGLDGVEVFTAAHTEADARFIRDCAVERHLLMTAGSDFHSEEAPSGTEVHTATAIGDYPTYGLPTDDVLPRLRAAMAEHARVR